MKIYFLISTFFITNFISAQIFAPNEAIWYYSYAPDLTLDDGYQKIEVLTDTLINNKNCKILQKTNIGYNYFNQSYYEIKDGQIVIYEEDSTVYYLKENLFYILYDFSAKNGDTFNSINYTENCNEQFTVRIDSVVNVFYNDATLKKFHITINDSVQSYYLEKIGYPGYLLPLNGFGCDIIVGPNYPNPLRCYTDNQIGNYSTNIVSECDYIMSITNNLVKNEKIEVFPNPAKNIINIVSGSNILIFGVEMYDIAGNCYYHNCNLHEHKIKIDLNEFTKGTYILKVETTNGEKTQKIIVR